MTDAEPLLYKIGIIGLGSQAKKIIDYLKRLKIVPHYIYVRKVKKEYKVFKNLTTSINHIEKCNVIFICSPNNTHFFYIKKFAINKNTYLFCEKPPVNSLQDLEALRELNHKNIYFNFNYRFSLFSKILSEVKKYNLGNLIFGSVVATHGLATKKKYFKSWRSNKNMTPLGIVEILSIHFIDLILNSFGIHKISFNNYKISKKSKNFDTSFINIITRDKKNITIFNSYNSALVEKKIFIFENGYIEQTENEISIFGPRNNFFPNGNFKKPKRIFTKKIKSVLDFSNSFEDSLKYFLTTVKKRKFFDKKLFFNSINSNKLILKILQR